MHPNYKRISKRLLACLLMLSLLFSTESIVLAEEIGEQVTESVDQIQETIEQAKRREQQEAYLAENQAETGEAGEPADADTDLAQSDQTGAEEVALRSPELPFEEADPFVEQYGEPVEVTEAGRVFQTGSSTFAFIGEADSGYFEEEDGEVTQTDHSLTAQKEVGLRSLWADPADTTYYTNQAGSAEIRLPGRAGPEKGIRMTNEEGQTLELFPADGIYENAVPLENALLYNDVFDQVDIQYTVLDGQIKEDIILRAPGGKSEFTYTFSNQQYEARLQNNVILLFDREKLKEDPDTGAAFYLSAPGMSDQAGAVSDQVIQTLTEDEEHDQYVLTVKAEATWLDAAERVYPVKIDPTITIPSANLEVVTTSSIHGTYAAEAYGYVGYTDDRVTGIPYADIGKTRMFFKLNYNFSSIIPTDAVVSAASLNTYAYSAYPSSATYVSYRLKGNWNPSAIDWGNSIGISREVSGAQSTQSGGKGWKSFDIRQSVNDWKEGIAPQYGLMVMATDENAVGNAFYTPYSNAGVQPGFTPNLKPYLRIDWAYPDPVDPAYSLDATTITLRSLVDSDISGKLTFQGVFADGIAAPGAVVQYALSDGAKNYTGFSAAAYTKKYPNSQPFESAFSATTTKYRDKQGNWQTPVPFVQPDLDKLYTISAAASKGAATGTQKNSERFTIYKVKQFDTLPKIASYYGIPLAQLIFDNRVQDMLVTANNTLFIRNPKKNGDKPYNPPALNDTAKAQIDAQLMGRGLHCQFGFEPVNLNTGNFYYTNTDASVPDLHGEFAVLRNYNSKGAGLISGFGRGWQFAYGEQLSKQEDGSILYTREDGSILCFTANKDGSYAAPEGYDLTLKPVKIRDNIYDFGKGKQSYPVYEYEIQDQAQTVKRFNCFGMLLSITDQQGNQTQLSYDANQNLKAVTSGGGVTYQFVMTEDGKVSTITLPNGGKLAYEYDENNNLTAYTDAAGGRVVYEYDDKHQMTAWYDSKVQKIITNTYDAEGRVTKQVDGTGYAALFSYEADQTITTDGNENQTIYTYDETYRTKKIEYPDGSTKTMDYAENRLVSETDELGHNTTYTYDDAGNRISETRFDGMVRTFTYNEDNECVSETDYSGRKTDYTYDSQGNLLTARKAGTTLVVFTYDNKGRMQTQQDANGNVTKYTYTGACVSVITDAGGGVSRFVYDAMGQVTEAEDANGDVTAYTYDLQGRRLSETDGAGNTTAYTLDANGQAIGMTEGNGNLLTYTYDALGRLSGGADSAGATISYQYDGNGNRLQEINGKDGIVSYQYNSRNLPVSMTDPAGNATAYTYDALGKLLTETNPKGQTTTYTYDYGTGNVETITDAAGHKQTFTYSPDGELLAQEFPDGTEETHSYDGLSREVTRIEANGLEIGYQYDPAGNLIQIDKEGVITTLQYDKLHRQTRQEAPDGGITQYTYDKTNHLRQVTDALGGITAYAYDGAGRMIQETSPLGQKTHYTYDGSGNLLKEVNAIGGVREYTYNSYQEIASETDTFGNTSHYTYDQTGQLVKVTDPLGNETIYERNETGQPETVTDALGNTSRTEYDANGNPAKISAPDGGETSYEYNELDQVIKETDSEGLVTEYEYDETGLLLVSRDNQGGRSEYTYDETGNLLSETNALDETTRYTYDKYGNLLREEKADGSITEFTYNAMCQVTSMTNPEGQKTLYEYDALGNLLKQTDHTGRETRYVYDSAGQLLREINPLGEESVYTYDGVGNVTAVTNALGSVEEILYDKESRVIGQKDGNGNLSTLEYDAAGNLVKAISPELGEEFYTYDALGNLLSYTDREGAKTHYAYDSMSRVVKQTMPTGGSYQYEYNTHGAPTKETTPSGAETHYTYDFYDQAVTRTLPGEAVYRYEYDQLGRLTSQQAPEGQERSYTYDISGNLVRETDQSHRSISYTYDRMQRLLAMENPLGQTTSYAYDEAGNLSSVVTPMGHKSEYRYDELDRLIQSTDPTGLVTEQFYDAAGNVKELKENGGRSTKYTYDAAGNTTSVTNALEETSTYTYDVMNRLTSETNASGNQTRYAYDKNDRITKITEAGGQETTLTYDGNGNTTSVTDGAGRMVRYEYDPSDRLTEVTAGAGSGQEMQVSYGYDDRDNLTSQTDGNGNTTRYTYNKLDQLTSEENALGQTEAYEYDQEARLSKVKRASGATITYDYNQLDELLRTSYSEEAEADTLFTYDREGKRVSMTDLTGTSAYTYDDAGRITGVQNGDGTVILYEYDAYGNLAGLTYPDGSQVGYQYDALNRLIGVTDREGKKTRYTYDASGNMTEVKRGNGTLSQIEYDETNQVSQVTNLDSQKQVISAYEYTYDLSGNVLTEQITQEGAVTTWSYAYNSRGELAQAEAKGATECTQIYSYDQAGNQIRIEQSEKNAQGHLEESVRRNQYNAANQLLVSADSLKGTTEYAYDADGNRIRELTPDEVAYEYTYDTENRLLAIKENGSLLQAALYDGDDNRVFVANRKIVTDESQLYGEQKNGTASGSTQSGEPEEEAEETKDAQKPKSKENGEFSAASAPEIRSIGYFWYGFWQNLTQAFSISDSTPGQGLHLYWEGLVTWYHVQVKGDWADEEGIVKNPVKELPIPEKEAAQTDQDTEESTEAGTGETVGSNQQRETLYDTVLIPQGVKETDRDTYLYTHYVNDVNQEYTQVLMEYGQSGSVSRIYEYGTERMQSTSGKGVESYAYDGRGNVANLTDTSGRNVVSYEYEVFGKATASQETENPYDYQGEYTDALTGNQYLRARYYQPNTGTFLTEDSLLGSLSEPLTQNRYTYTGNDPINLSDPSGHGWLSNAVKKVTKAVKTVAKKVVSTVKKVVKKVASTIKKVATKVVNTIKKVIGGGSSGGSSGKSSGGSGGGGSGYKGYSSPSGRITSPYQSGGKGGYGTGGGPVSMSGLLLNRHMVLVGGNLVSQYEKRMCDSEAGKIKTQGVLGAAGVAPGIFDTLKVIAAAGATAVTAGVATPVLIVAGVGLLAWQVGEGVEAATGVNIWEVIMNGGKSAAVADAQWSIQQNEMKEKAKAESEAKGESGAASGSPEDPNDKNKNNDSKRMTTKEATKAAKELGYEPTNYTTKSGEKVFYNKKSKTYISQDVGSGDGSGSHNGGTWKMAKSPEALGRKSTRMGTYDAELNRIGD